MFSFLFAPYFIKRKNTERNFECQTEHKCLTKYRFGGGKSI